MKKLFSCNYGSRLYGTQTPTSDTDVKHIVLPDLDDLLVGKKLVNKVKKTNSVAFTKNTAEDIDEEFIPLQVFAQDFFDGQTYALELAFALEGTHAGQDFHGCLPRTTLFYQFVVQLRKRFLTSNIKAMMGYVVNQASLYSFKGERLNVAKLFRDYVKDHMETWGDEKLEMLMFETDSCVTLFPDMMRSLARDYPKYFKVTEYDIGDGRMKPCFTLLEKTFPFSSTVKHTFGVADALVKKYGTRAEAASESNVDWKATMHALRIVDEGLSLLETGSLEFPFHKKYVERLLSIKRGEQPLDPIKEELAEKLARLKELEKTTKLPEGTPERRAEFDLWLKSQLRMFYNLEKA